MTKPGQNARTATMTGLAALAAACSASPALAAPAQAPITIGIIDAKGDRLAEPDANTTIVYTTFADRGWQASSREVSPGVDHGQAVASAFVKQVRAIDRNAPIRILSANVLQERNDGNPGEVNWNGAKNALAWFHDHGVKVVMTSFSSNTDTQALRAFAKEAARLDMIVFADAGTQAKAPAFPAAYAGIMSVSGNAADAAIRKDPTMSPWVDIVADGTGPGAEGASLAIARTAAYGAYFAARNPKANSAEIDAGVRNATVVQSLSVRGDRVTISYLDQARSPSLMRSQTMAASPSKGPTAEVAILDPRLAKIQHPGR